MVSWELRKGIPGIPALYRVMRQLGLYPEPRFKKKAYAPKLYDTCYRYGKSNQFVQVVFTNIGYFLIREYGQIDGLRKEPIYVRCNSTDD